MSIPNLTGIVIGETNRQYHAHRALSHSGLEDFRTRPAFYKRKHIDEVIKTTEKACFTFGTMFHTAVLEPEQFAGTYAVEPPDAPRRPTERQINAKKPSDSTVEAIDYWNDWNAKNGGREVVKSADMARVDAMQVAVCGNSMAAALLEGAPIKETTFRTPLTAFGVQMQCRPDAYSPTGCDTSANVPYNVDLKSVADMDRFLKQFHDFGYYRQSPFYRTVQATVNSMPEHAGYCPEPQRFFYVAVESVEPFGCTVFEADPLSLKIGQDEVNEDLEKMRRCIEENRWPNSPDVGTAGLPAWRVTSLMEEAA